MIKTNRLSFRIIIRVFVITTSLFVVIMLGYNYFTSRIIREAARENAIELAGNLAGRIEQILQPMEKIPEMVASTMELGLIHPDSLDVILQSILLRNPTIYGAAIAFEPDYFPEKGTYHMLYSYREHDQVSSMMLGDENYNYFYMDWYQIPAIMQKTYWSEPYFDEGAGNVLMATYSVPFYCTRDGERRFAGIATVDLELDWLTDIVNAVRIFDTGYAFMLSRNGVAVTHPDRTMIMNKSIFSNAEEWDAPIMREIGRELISGKSQFRQYTLPGRPKLWTYYRNLESNQWSIMVVFPDREMYAGLRAMNTMLIFFILAGLILLSLILSGVINRLSRPLVHFAASARTIAEGNFDTKLPRVTTGDEMQELRDAFAHMQDELSTYIVNLKDATAAKEKIESELRIARDIQMAMIPHTFPPFPDLPQVDLFAVLKSAKEVGGDLYDFFIMDEDKFCFAVGDVSGKGVPASLFMAMTRTLLRTIADREKSPARIMEALNRSLAFNNESNMFVTFFLGILDLRTGNLHFANAGHNPPVILPANGGTKTFEAAKSIPLGLFEDFIYQDATLQLDPGDKIFAYTDGVSEAENKLNELFDEVRMLAILEKHGQASPRDLIRLMDAAIDLHVGEHPQSDDITMLTVAYNG